MGKNILAVLIASTFIVACSGNSTSRTSIKAYDGPVQFADVEFDCDTTTGTISGNAGQTDYYGAVYSANVIINTTPELCEFVFTGNADSIDTSNGKLMPDIEYIIPRGLSSAGVQIVGGPLTTLIAKQIKADVTPRSIEEVVNEVVTDLYGATFVEDLANNANVSPLDLAQDMEGTIKKLKTLSLSTTDVPPVLYESLVIATNHVTNDALVYSKKATVPLTITSLITTSKAITKKVVTDNPKYPLPGLTGTGDPIYITVTEVNELAPESSVIVPHVAEPLPEPATGGA